jgi:integration host factor subunit beta
MNKVDLIEAIKTEAGLTKNEATAIVNLFFDEMSNALANGDRVDC